MSSAEIQKSAAGITFSNISLLLTLFYTLKWYDWNDTLSTSLLLRHGSVV